MWLNEAGVKATSRKQPAERPDGVDPEARTGATRQKRLGQAVEWMSEGKTLHWKCMAMRDSIDESTASGITAFAKRVFGNREAAREWLTTPNPALGDEVPSRLLATGNGVRQVEAVLIRIEHGVFE